MTLIAPNCIIELWDNMDPADFPQPFAIVMGTEILGFDSKEERAAAMSGGLVQSMIERNSRDWVVKEEDGWGAQVLSSVAVNGSGH